MTRKKLALCVGINTYPAAPLAGCVNDARAWTDLLETEGYWTDQLLNEVATKQAVVTELDRLVEQARYGDRIVVTYSGHGTWVPDVDGDEPDARDEALCLYDYASGGLLLDDELHAIFARRRFGVRVTILSDSCYSGTVMRQLKLAGDPLPGRPRFLDPQAFLGPVNALTYAHVTRTVRAEVRGDVAPAVDGMRATAKRTGTPLFSGCAEDEVSYDAWIDGIPQGAFTNAAIRSYRPGITYRQWYTDIRRMLPSTSYPQSPQLQSSLWQRGWTL